MVMPLAHTDALSAAFNGKAVSVSGRCPDNVGARTARLDLAANNVAVTNETIQRGALARLAQTGVTGVSSRSRPVSTIARY
jgi:hypothetical protein